MKRVLFLGDSITDCDRLFSPNSLGYGYVNQLDTALNREKHQFEMINRGVDGFTVNRLVENVGRDCIDRHPDITTILIGINDVGLMMNTDRTPAQQQDMLSQFKKSYEQLLSTIHTYTQSEILLLEPFLFPHPQKYLRWFPFVEQISMQISELSLKYHCPYIRLHQKLNQLATQNGFSQITTDGIHLTDFGHRQIAEELLPYFSV